MKLLGILVLLFATSFGAAGIDIDYMSFVTSTYFTNNGGVDNSTCNLKIDAYYNNDLTVDNYAGFIWMLTDPGNALASTQAFVAGDIGFACTVNYVGGGTSWQCG